MLLHKELFCCKYTLFFSKEKRNPYKNHLFATAIIKKKPHQKGAAYIANRIAILDYSTTTASLTFSLNSLQGLKAGIKCSGTTRAVF